MKNTTLSHHAEEQNVHSALALIGRSVDISQPDEIKYDDIGVTMIWISGVHLLIIVCSQRYLTGTYSNIYDESVRCEASMWLGDQLPEPYDLSGLVSLIRRYQMASAKIPTMTALMPDAANDPHYLTVADKIAILVDFDLTLDLNDNPFSPTYFVVDSQNNDWLQTHCQIFDDALDVAIDALKERCYLPTPFNEIIDYIDIDRVTHDELQQQIKTHGAQTAKAIQCIYAIFTHFYQKTGVELPKPESITLDKNLMTYIIRWPAVEIMVDSAGNILHQPDDKIVTLSLPALSSVMRKGVVCPGSDVISL